MSRQYSLSLGPVMIKLHRGPARDYSGKCPYIFLRKVTSVFIISYCLGVVGSLMAPGIRESKNIPCKLQEDKYKSLFGYSLTIINLIPLPTAKASAIYNWCHRNTGR